MVRKIEKDPNEGNKVVVAKVAFLVLLVITAVLVQQYSHSLFKPLKQTQKKPNYNVLGASSIGDLQKSIQTSVGEAGVKAKELRAQIQTQVETLLEEKRDEIEASVSSALYDSAVKPVITQFSNLPEKQKEAVRGAICK